MGSDSRAETLLGNSCSPCTEAKGASPEGRGSPSALQECPAKPQRVLVEAGVTQPQGSPLVEVAVQHCCCREGSGKRSGPSLLWPAAGPSKGRALSLAWLLSQPRRHEGPGSQSRAIIARDLGTRRAPGERSLPSLWSTNNTCSPFVHTKFSEFFQRRFWRSGGERVRSAPHKSPARVLRCRSGRSSSPCPPPVSQKKPQAPFLLQRELSAPGGLWTEPFLLSGPLPSPRRTWLLGRVAGHGLAGKVSGSAPTSKGLGLPGCNPVNGFSA